MTKLYAILFSCVFVLSVKAQYTTLASPSNPGVLQTNGANYVEFRLTTTSPIEQAGAVWKNAQYNLNSDFTLYASLNFGSFSETNPDLSKHPAYQTGADGIGLVLSTAQYLGDVGEEVGYGTTPQTGGVWVPNQSLAVEFDTWRNITCCAPYTEGYRSHNDPDGNHLAMMSKGQTIHGTAQQLVAPISLANDLEDGLWHDVTITWTAATRTFTVTSTSGFPFSITRSLTAGEMTTIFGASSNVMVYLGFTAGTGSAANVHRVRFITPRVNCTAGTTFTIGGWGAEPHGGNPGTYLHDHFAGAFPTGLTVGNTSGNYNVHFTSAQSITDYLPAGGPSKKLTQNYNNPATTDLKNTLVSQLIGVTLAVGMDNTYADFSPSDVTLGNMIINSGPFTGWTVNAFLAAANAALGGAASAYTLDQFNATATAINENYDGGTTDNGYLVCPNNIQTSRAIQGINTNLTALTDNNVTAYPNPSRGQIQLNVGSLRNAQIQIVNARGIIVERKLTGNAQTVSLDLKKYGTGVYIVKVISGLTVKTSKVLIQ